MTMDPKAPINDPHQYHQLIEGPTRLDIHHYMGICKCDWSLEQVEPDRIPLTCPGCGRFVDVIPCETGEWVIEEHGMNGATDATA